jgi:phosphoribosyl-ATP pyrophosphohydrolase/phosphoribosyl-AMP cyclohydrolase
MVRAEPIQLNFEKLNGLVPAVVQHHATNEVLMVGFMNRDAWDMTLHKGLVTFWSRDRKTLWTKGETSGNFLRVKRIQADCDRDTLLIAVDPVGPVCHTGQPSCFFEDVDAPSEVAR